MDRVRIVGKENISERKEINYTDVTPVLERMEEEPITWLRKEMNL